MNPTRFSPAAFMLIALGLFSQSEVHAGASNKNGNPYGNGTFFQTTGTFSAVIRGENLSGTMLFSTGIGTNGSSTNDSGGSTTIAYNGNTYQGNASGMWNPSSGSINGEFWGSQNLSGTNSQVQYPEIYNATNGYQVQYNSDGTISTNADGTTNYSSYYFPYPINIINVTNNVATDTNGVTASSNTTVTNTIYIEPQASNSYQDSVSISGYFNGNTENQYPNQTFTAQGTLIQKQLVNQDAYVATTNHNEGTIPKQVTNVTIPVTVQGIRISDSYSTFASLSNAVPYSQTAYNITNISKSLGQ